MKKDFKNLPGSKIELKVTLEDKEFAGYYEAADSKAAGEVTIKGFRKGAAPKEMIAGAIDHDKVFHEAMNEAVRWSLNTIKQEKEWTFIAPPHIEVVEGEPGKGVVYKATLTIFPEVTLGDYKKIAKKVFSKKPEVIITEEEIKKTIDWVRGSRAVETRAIRPAKLGDLVEVDIDTEHDGKPVERGALQGDRFVLGESNFIKGFDAQLVGKPENEVVHFSIVAPDDYWNVGLRGKQLDFTVTMRGIFDRVIPELTDEFAKGLGSQFSAEGGSASGGKTPLEKLRASVKEGLTMEKTEKEMEKLRIKVIEEITKDSKIDVPEILIERTLNGMMADYAKMMPKETAAKEQEKFMAEMKEKLRERAEHGVRGNLVLYKLAQIEQLAPTAEEIEQEAKKHNVDPEKEHEYIYSALQNKKIFEFLEGFAEKA